MQNISKIFANIFILFNVIYFYLFKRLLVKLRYLSPEFDIIYKKNFI